DLPNSPEGCAAGRWLGQVLPLQPGERAIVAPLQVEGQSEGILLVLGRELHEADRAPVSVFSLQIAAALENAHLFAREQRRRRLAETLNRVMGALAATLDPEEVLNLILDQVHEVIPYDSASFMLPQGEVLRVVAGRGYPDEARLQIPQVEWRRFAEFEKALVDRQVVIVPNTREHPRWVSVPGTEYIKTWICIPLAAGDEVKGVLNIDMARPFQPRDEEVAALQSFAAKAGVALRNAELYQETNRLKEFNEALVQEMQEGLVLSDPQGVVLFANPALAQALGLAAIEIVGQPWSRFIAPHPGASAVGSVPAHSEATTQGDALLLSASGAAVPVHVSERPVMRNGQMVGHLSVLTDLREHLAYEERLRAANEYLTGLLANIPLGVARVNRGGEVTYSNGVAQAMWQAQFGDALPNNLWEEEPLASPGFFEDLHRAMQDEAVAPRELWFRGPTGEERYLRLQGVPIHDAQDQVAELLLLMEDLTARRSLEEHVQRMQKMDALAHLTRQVVHEFNNTLAMALGYTSALQVDLPPNHPAQEDLAALLRVIRRGSELPGQLLTFASGGGKRPEPVDCNGLVQEVLRLLQRTAPTVEVRMLLDAGASKVEGDAGDLQQVLMNLALNAVEAMPGGGPLTVGTENVVLNDGAVALLAGCRPG
ncbi:MAG: GAF domain-containing protein, partial [Chloroflexi bacterium]|nr:GAF domain-containing protein [Chloroflexota bacterium]